MPDSSTPNRSSSESEPSWRKLYGLVLLELALVVGALYALTRWAA